MIEVKNLTKRYGPVRAVNDITFTVGDGGVYGFLGPNGAGKSTTMNIITGCLAASSGSVTINGNDIFDDPIEAKRLIGYLPENPPLYGELTPEEYLCFVARAKGVNADRINAEVERVMKRCGLTTMAERLIRNLSKGYKQRVGIAQALLGDPKYIILDEPTVGLDPLQIIEIRELIRELGKTHTVILSSHVLPEISAVCDYVIVIAHGKIVASDTLENLNRSFSETEIIRIETRTNPDKLRSELERLDGADKVTVQQMATHVAGEIEVKHGCDIREDVSNILRALDAPVLTLSSSAQNLEDIFIKLVNEQYEIEPEDPAMPRDIRAEKASAKKKSAPRGRAYITDDADGASNDANDTTDVNAGTDNDGAYTPLFGDTDEEDSDK